MVAPWDRRSLDEQERLRDLLLQQWLPAAADYSPFWREHLARYDVEPADVDSLGALRRLPPLREQDTAWAGGPGGPALLMRPTEGQVKAHATGGTLWRIAQAVRGGGSAGKRSALLQEYKPIHVHRAGRDGALGVAYTRSDLDRLHRAGARAAAVLGLSDTDYLVSAVAPTPTLGFWGLYHLALGSSLLALHLRGADDDLDAVAEGFALVPATAVAVTTHEAVTLATALAEAGAELARVRTVVLVGAPPASEDRAAVAEAWRSAGAAPDVRVQALWAPADARAPWAECASGTSDDASTGLHLYPDLEVVELVDPLTRGAVDVGEGDLTYTSAGWHGTALIRHQTGDYVEGLVTDPCPGCGRTVPRLVGEVVPGAWQPAVETGEGWFRADLRGAAEVAGRDPRVAGWRVELRGPTSRIAHDRLLVEVAGSFDEGTEDLEDALTAACGVAPHQVKVLDAETLERRTADAGVFVDLR